jgi:hypothetical protein
MAKEKFEWPAMSEAQKDSILQKVVKPYLDSNWTKMGFIEKGAARKALEKAGKYKRGGK